MSRALGGIFLTHTV